MSAPQKSTVDQIRQRFDADVERFSNLETGQSATLDAPLVLDLITHAAATCTPNARHLVDIGCGAGNYTLKTLQLLPNLDCTLLDLSLPMLTRARQRVSAATSGTITTLQTDIRALPLPENSADILLAAAVFHHLRTDDEWLAVFSHCFRALRPGGSLWIADLIAHSTPPIQQLMWSRYGDYLSALKGGGPEGEAYRNHVFAYVEAEDTPKPLLYQLDLLRRVGFQQIELLHKNSLFAAFGALKEPRP